MLNPLSAVFCRHASHSRKSDPTLIPLVFNNTIPSKVVYTVTSFDDPPRSHTLTVPASQLVRRAHPSRHLTDSSQVSAQDDELALASEWSLVPASKSSSQALRHTLPEDRETYDKNDPFRLSPSESLYYLPITAIGSIRLESIEDADGHPIRIRRKRTAVTGQAAHDATNGTVVRAFEETRILRCPTAGFSLDAGVLGYAGAVEEHRCLAPNQGVPETWPLGLVVSGTEPLSVKWYSREGDKDRGVRREQELAGIVGASGASDSVIPVPMNASLAKPGRTTFYIETVSDSAGNVVSYAGDLKNPLAEGTIASRAVVVHRPPEVAFVGECARGEEVHLLRQKTKNQSRKLQMKLSGIDEELHDTRHGGRCARFEVDVKYTPEDSTARGWVKRLEATGPRLDFEVDQPGTYEIVDIKSEHCPGAVLVPNSVSCPSAFAPSS